MQANRPTQGTQLTHGLVAKQQEWRRSLRPLLLLHSLAAYVACGALDKNPAFSHLTWLNVNLSWWIGWSQGPCVNRLHDSRMIRFKRFKPDVLQFFYTF